MKRLSVFIAIIIPSIAMAQIPSSNQDSVYKSENVDSIAKFPGSSDAFYKFLSKNMRYPADARENNIQGKVIAEFIVNEDGSLSNVKIIQSLGHGCDEEFLRVINLMPKWIPARKNGKPVKSLIKLPNNFKLGK
jgi:protein TonB